MTEDETVPAQSPRQAEDAYLAAVSALLCAMATNRLVTPAEADVLADAMPSDDLRDGFLWGLGMMGLRG
jgi:hypothetical protein